MKTNTQNSMACNQSGTVKKLTDKYAGKWENCSTDFSVTGKVYSNSEKKRNQKLITKFIKSLKIKSSLNVNNLLETQNIEEQLQDLHMQFHRTRQMTITEELLDIVAGFEAMQEEAS